MSVIKRGKSMKKVYNQKGVTLIEMLVTVIVMLLVSEIILLCIQLSTKYYKESVKSSESQTICGSLSLAIQEELQYATKIQPTANGALDEDGNYQGFTYYSRARQHGSNCSLVCDDGKIYVRKSGNDYALLGAKTNSYDLQADMKCRWNPGGFFSVDLKIMDGEKELAGETFFVYPLNEGY